MKNVIIALALCFAPCITFADTCTAKTKKGVQCTRHIAKGKTLCWQHDPKHPSNVDKKSAK